MGAEHEDMILSWGHLYLTYNEKCVDAPGEALPNYEIFRRLAKKMNLKQDQFSWSDEKCLENYVNWSAPACEGITLEKLKENHKIEAVFKPNIDEMVREEKINLWNKAIKSLIHMHNK